jgi:hypothetical protein
VVWCEIKKAGGTTGARVLWAIVENTLNSHRGL